MLNKLVLLPSARLVPAELRPDLGPIPSGMVPVNSRPALHRIAEPYAAKGFSAAVAVYEAAPRVCDYMLAHPELNIQCVNVGDTSSIGETVAKALDLLPAPRSLVIQFADTLIGDAIDARDFICYQDREDVYRWTTFEIAAGGDIYGVAEKNTAKARAGRMPAFDQLSDTQRNAISALLAQCLDDPDPGLDPFYSAVVEYFNSLSPGRRRLIPVKDWMDVGHLDTYYASQRKFFLGSRAFNSLCVDPGRGVIRKTSENAAKLQNEIAWYLGLPAQLQYLAPRVFDHSTEPANTFADIEFYGYPALNDVYVYGEWDLGVWSQVLQGIGLALDGMATHLDPSATPDNSRQAIHEMYVLKTAERLWPLLEDPRMGVLCQDSLEINGRVCTGLARSLEAIPRMMDLLHIYDCPPFTVIHGDLCLSNILYDRRAGFVRLIDPRGAFGRIGIYGDPRYELAKLSHSFEGDYDFLVNGLFEVRQEPGRVSLTPALRRHHRAIKQLFHSWLLERSRDRYQQVKFIEALLFLSMASLHQDRPRSQFAFLTRALEILQDIADAASCCSIHEGVIHDGAAEHNYHYHGR